MLSPMQNRYLINVAFLGRHWLRAELDGIGHTDAQAVEKARDLARRFPEGEGYAVTLTKWEAAGRGVAL
jgi:hypothetical protein